MTLSLECTSTFENTFLFLCLLHDLVAALAPPSFAVRRNARDWLEARLFLNSEAARSFSYRAT